MSTVAAVILGKERRMVATFVARGAVTREQARTLDELGLSRGIVLRRLRERAVVREAAPDHYYLDQESWAAVRRARRRAVHVAAAIALAVLLAMIFGTRRARASETVPRAQSAEPGESQRPGGANSSAGCSPTRILDMYSPHELSASVQPFSVRLTRKKFSAGTRHISSSAVSDRMTS